MMNLPVSVEILQETRLQMRLGRSLTSSIRRALEKKEDSFSQSLKIWLLKIEAGQRHGEILESLPALTCHTGRRLLLDVFERGLKGASIVEALDDLEKEFFFSIENSFERHLQLLPVKLLMPLTLFILPSVLMLIVGPLLFSMKGGF